MKVPGLKYTWTFNRSPFHARSRKTKDLLRSTNTNYANNSIVLGSTVEEEEICCICERAPVNVTFFPCEHRTCDECSRRWRRCHVTLAGSICGIACRTEIRGRRMRIAAAAVGRGAKDKTAPESDALKCESFSYD